MVADGNFVRYHRLDLGGLDAAKRLVLRVSHDGRFVAVAEEFGSQGRVFDNRSGGLALSLNRGDYHEDVSAFPLAFFEREGRTLLIHGTDWNRLDVSDPASGQVLTPRGPTSYRRDEPRPEHYLDYFHGRLHVSPDGRWVAEDGWLWHPIGIPRAWSLGAWVENVWESEDGPTVRNFPERLYFWDGPMSWVDGRRLAIWGLGDDDEAMEPGIRIFDVETGEETATFPGPSVAPHRVWPPASGPRGWMTFDGWLYAISPEEGTSVWTIEDGGCLHREPGFAPAAYHPEAGCFLAWKDGQATLSRFEP